MENDGYQKKESTPNALIVNIAALFLLSPFVTAIAWIRFVVNPAERAAFAPGSMALFLLTYAFNRIA